MTPEQLVDHLEEVSLITTFLHLKVSIYSQNVNIYKIKYYDFSEYNVDGKRMLQLSRNDIAILFPKEDQFALGMDLFKYIETLQATSSGGGASLPKPPENNGASNPQQPNSLGTGAAKPQQSASRKHPSSSLPFTLPLFEPDLEQAIKKYAFFNPQKRAKLIRKACEAMAGYCRENSTTPSMDLQELAKTLISMAQRSLSDPTTGKRGESTAHVSKSIHITLGGYDIQAQ